MNKDRKRIAVLQPFIGNVYRGSETFFMEIMFIGCFMYLSLICDMCISLLFFTPISTKAPKSITFRTVPFKIIPGFKSFISNFI